jgi:hypothetical protein
MPHFFGHTHAKHSRHGSSLAERGEQPDRTNSLVRESSLAADGARTREGRGRPVASEIAERAYSYWEARGFQGGSPWEDWFRAERELTKPGL